MGDLWIQRMENVQTLTGIVRVCALLFAKVSLKHAKNQRRTPEEKPADFTILHAAVWTLGMKSVF